MIARSSILIVFLINSLLFVTYAQENSKKFNLGFPKEKTQNSLYDKLRFVDSRPDTTDFGFVQTGMLNHKAKLIPEDKLAFLFQRLLQNMIDSTAQDGEILFELRQLAFSEATGMLSEKGFCSFKANLYEKLGENYKKLASIDTLETVSAMDVTGGLLKAGGKIVCEFIRDNLQKKSAETELFSYHQVVKMDSVEKQKIKLYTTEKYNDGLYYSYKSFCEQTPDKEASVVLKEGKVSSVKITNSDDKLVKVKPKEAYALVFQGIPYIATRSKFCLLTKKDDDFYFIGTAKKSASSTDMFVATYMFGILGAALMSSNLSGIYEMKIDHKTGAPIILKEVIETEEY